MARLKAETVLPVVRSYWAATARYETKHAPLESDAETDVVIVGAGFTGLSTAYHLAKSGRSCMLLEGQEVGWGASGRNGGSVVPRFRLTFPELERRYGVEMALRMHRWAHEAVDTLEAITRDLGVGCAFERRGHLTPIQREQDEKRFSDDVEWLARHAGDKAPRMLDRAETARKVGSQFYRAAYLEPRGGGIHPLDYCQGVAAKLVDRGVRVHCRTPVLEWKHDGDAIIVSTARARVRTKHLVLATNAYTDTTHVGDDLKRRFVPIVSAQIATEPLSSATLSTLLPDGNPATDSKRLTNYFHRTPDGRLMFGGRAGASDRESVAIFRRLSAAMATIYPQLEEAPIAFRWSGRVAVSMDNVPHLGRLNDRVSFGLGYSGRGVALSALFGARLADLAAGNAVDLGPLTQGAFEPIRFHAFQVPGKAIAMAYKRVLDAIGV